MDNKIYVGNLSYQAQDSELATLFGDYGNVLKVNVVKDRDSGRGRGFGFVEMNSSAEADQAVMALNEKDFLGRTLVVNIAKPRENRSFRH